MTNGGSQEIYGTEHRYFQEKTNIYMQFESALSTERLSTYMQWANQDSNIAKELYGLNMALSEALYTPLHMLEITLRNAIHNRMIDIHGEKWFTNNQLIIDHYLQNKVLEAYKKHGKEAKDGQIVAELTFGFWTALFSPHNNHLWQYFHQIFAAPVKRKTIAGKLNRIRRVRNRIAHHEVIIQHDLLASHSDMRELIGWLSTEALIWCDTRCRFMALHPQVPIIVGNLKNPALVFQTSETEPSPEDDSESVENSSTEHRDI